MDRGAWQATVHRLEKSQTWLKWLSTHMHMGILDLTFWGTTSLFSTAAEPLYIPTSNVQVYPILPHSCQHLFSVFIIIFIMISTLVDVKWYYDFDWRFSNDSWNWTSHVLVGCLRSLEKCLLKFFVHVLIGRFSFIQLSCVYSFC